MTEEASVVDPVGSEFGFVVDCFFRPSLTSIRGDCTVVVLVDLAL